MKNDCLDIGIIQSFLDGELAGSEMTRVSTHVAVCDACTAMLAQAEDESALVFPALGREFDTLVPTQRLWSRINESIAIEKQKASFWAKAYAFLVTAFASPSITVAAGLLIVGGVFAILTINRSSVEPLQNDIAKAPASSTTTSTSTKTTEPFVSSNDDKVTSPSSATSIRPERAAYRTDFRRRPNVQPASYKPQTPAATTAAYMPGEESYVKTIANLSKTVEDKKAGGVLRPSLQVAYERDMAVVDDAITKMRAALKRNPRNESAKQILYSSYQNKIDLLNAVAQKEELIASR